MSEANRSSREGIPNRGGAGPAGGDSPANPARGQNGGPAGRSGRVATGTRPGMSPRPVASPNGQPASNGSPSRPVGNGSPNGNGRNGTGQGAPRPVVRSNGQPGQSGARPSRPGAPAPQNGADQAKESLRNRLGLGQKEQPSGAAGGSRNGAQSSAGSPNRPVVRAAGNRQPGTPVARANPSQSAGTSQPTANQPTATQAAVTRTGSSPEPRSGAGRPDTGVRSGVAAPQARAGTPSSPSGVSATRSGSPTTIGTARSAGSPTERSRDLGLPEAKPKAGQARRTRKARLRLSRLDPWSVMKTSFLFSISAGIVLVVAVYAIWTVLEGSGLFESINLMIGSVTDAPNDTTPFRIEEYVNTAKVMGVAALIACVDVVILTALATLGSFLYNLAATMLGGLEVTLAED